MIIKNINNEVERYQKRRGNPMPRIPGQSSSGNQIHKTMLIHLNWCRLRNNAFKVVSLQRYPHSMILWTDTTSWGLGAYLGTLSGFRRVNLFIIERNTSICKRLKLFRKAYCNSSFIFKVEIDW